jgi:hypothetical protein
MMESPILPIPQKKKGNIYDPIKVHFFSLELGRIYCYSAKISPIVDEKCTNLEWILIGPHVSKQILSISKKDVVHVINKWGTENLVRVYIQRMTEEKRVKDDRYFLTNILRFVYSPTDIQECLKFFEFEMDSIEDLTSNTVIQMDEGLFVDNEKCWLKLNKTGLKSKWNLWDDIVGTGNTITEKTPDKLLKQEEKRERRRVRSIIRANHRDQEEQDAAEKLKNGSSKSNDTIDNQIFAAEQKIVNPQSSTSNVICDDNVKHDNE